MKRRHEELKAFVTENWKTAHGLCCSNTQSFCEYAAGNHEFLTELADRAKRGTASEIMAEGAIDAMRELLGLNQKQDDTKKA